MGFLWLNSMLEEVLIMIGCSKWLYNRLQVTRKGRFDLCVSVVSRRFRARFAMLMPRRRAYLFLTIRYTWLGLSALFIKTTIHHDYLFTIYQNAMTLSSPRMNGVATICFFSWLPPTKLIKFVTARQQMKRTVGATP